MKTNCISRLLWTVVIVAVMLACSKDESQPDSIPVIQLKSIDKYALSGRPTKRDSVVITINFKDQDGNLGESDSSRIRQVFANQGWGNYRLEVLQFTNGVFSPLPMKTTSKLFFPYGSVQNKPIEGDLSFSQSYPYTDGYRLIPVKFKVQIRDRNLNESNVVETDTIRLPVAP